MGWFDEQIRKRKECDDDAFGESFARIAGAVTGRTAGAGESCAAKDAIDEILKYYHVKRGELPEGLTDINEQMEHLMRPHGIMRRTVRLDSGWHRDAMGAMLAFRRDGGSPVALIPSGPSGYTFLDRDTGKRIRINFKNEALFQPEAQVFYMPFPLKSMGVRHLFLHIVNSLSVSDYVLFALASLAVMLVGLISPALNNIIFSNLVGTGSARLILAMTVFLACLGISTAMLSSVKALLLAHISTKLEVNIQAGTMMRILSLPADFFKAYSSGDLSSRAQYINLLCQQIVTVVLSTGLTSIFSLAYIGQIFAYAPALTLPALAVIFSTLLFSLISAIVQAKVTKRRLAAAAKESGMSYALISGVQKIKLSGAEKRAFARWGDAYAGVASLTYDPPLFLRLNQAISTAITLAGTIAIYFIAVGSAVSVADYYSFNTAYGMVSGAFVSLSSVALTIAQFKPILDMAKPIMEAVPEVSGGKQVIFRLFGGIEINNVSFRYSEHMPLVVDDLSLKIRPGQYVAIVGATGCGKSTLMRLLLGFETPQKGAIYYDGRDLSTIDLKSLRRKIGVVMQDGKLFQGDIYSNIVISAPWLSVDDAWKAAELAGIDEDIRHMPMGMHTMISEGAGGVSGGQRQRLMIARAIAPNPRILMFDEATSALDNLTQKKVSESLGSLKCTRIVIAHRLSTIKHCDRILFLEKGKIVEDGTYEELIALNGRFAELIARQRLNGED